MKQTIGTESISKLVLNNAIPAIIAMVMVLVYNMADMFFIGQTNDPLQVAAVSLATPIFMIFMALSSVFGIGGTSLISRSFGAGKEIYAKKVSSFCFWSALVVGVVLSTLIIIFANPLATILGASNETLSMVSNYLTIVAISGPFILISSAFSNIIRAEGNPKIATLGMIIGNLVNIALDPVFILGADLGISGAAIATVLGNIVATLFYIFYFIKGKSKLSINPKDFTTDKATLKNVLVIGVPASLSSLLMSVSTIIVNGFMAEYGDLAVAGIGVAMKVTMITTFVCIGFGQGIQPLLGHAYGAKDYNKFKAIMRFSVIFSLGIGIVLASLCYLALPQIISAFLTDIDAYSYAFSFAQSLLLSSFIFGVLFVIINALQAIGAATSSLILNISRQGLFFMPIVFILNYTFGLYGIVYTQPITDILTFILAILLYKRASKNMLSESTIKKTQMKTAEIL